MLRKFAKVLLRRVVGNKIKHINTIKKFIEDHKKGKKMPPKRIINVVCAAVGLI